MAKTGIAPHMGLHAPTAGEKAPSTGAPSAANASVSATSLSTSQPWPSAASAWFVVIVLVLANALSFVDRMVLSLLVAPIRASFQVSDTEVSLLLGFAFVVFYIFMGIPLAWLADRYSRRNLIMAGVLVWSAMIGFCGLATSYFMLFLGRMGVGAGEAVLSPSAMSLLSDYFPREKLGKAIAVYQIGIPLGGGIALIISSIILNALVGSPSWNIPGIGAVEAWRLIFFWIALPGLVVALLLMRVKEPARRGNKVVTSEGTTATVGLKQHFVNNAWTLAALIFGISMIAVVMYGLVSWVPTFLIRTYGMTMGKAGLVFGILMVVSGTGGLLTGGAWTDRMFRKGHRDAHMRVMLYASIIAIPLFIGAMLMPTDWMAIVMLLLACYVLANYGAGLAAIPLITPNALRARTMSIVTFMMTLIGLGLGPTAIAMLTDYYFKDPVAIRYSMLIVGTIALILASIIFSISLKHYRLSIEHATASDG